MPVEAPKAQRRTRPKDRSERIVRAAAELFSERGFHAVSLNDIGDAVDITGPAVYRHFESKEALLLAVIEQMVEQFLASYEAAVDGVAAPDDQIAALARETIGRQLEQRNFWNLSLAEVRHLPEDSVRHFMQSAEACIQYWVRPVRALQKDLAPREARYLVEVGTGLAASLLYYDAPLSPRRSADVLGRMMVDAYVADGSAVPDVPGPHQDPQGWSASALGTPLRAAPRERVLAAAVQLFRQSGFNGVGIDDIGAASGITGPGIYRHFKSKEDILLAALTRMNEQLMAGMGRALAGVTDPKVALGRIVDAYLYLVLEDPDLMAIYWSERRVLPPEVRSLVDRNERSFADDLTAIVHAVTGNVTEPEARTMAYGAIGLMNGHLQGAVKLPVRRARELLRGMTIAAVLGS